MNTKRPAVPLMHRCAMESVITNPETKAPLDLSRSNTIRALLAEWEELREQVRAAQDRVSHIEHVIKTAIGEHELAVLPGYEIRYSAVHRRQCVIPASDYRRLVIRQTDEPLQ
jgi:predicted phage-related endonuclease